MFANGFYAAVDLSKGAITEAYTKTYFVSDWVSAFANMIGLLVLVQTLCLLIDLNTEVS